MSSSRLSYRFGPLERHGILGGVSGSQAVVLAAAALGAIVVLDATPSIAGALASVVLFGAACATMLVPLGRRTLDEWLPLGVRYAVRYLTRRRKGASPAPAAGLRVAIAGGRLGGAPLEGEPRPPRGLRDVRVVALHYRDRMIGALAERSGSRLTAVLACRVSAFALLDPEAQERRLARWGLILSAAAGTSVRRIGWIERTAPAQADELARWLHTERDPAVPLRGTPMIESYLELIGSTARVTQEHEILVALQVDSRRLRERGRGALARALVEQTERIAQGLEAAEVTVVGALGQGQLARTLRTAFDPYARTELTALQAADPGRDELSETATWPLGTSEGWEHFRSDGAVHATYWIAGWPRIDVSPMFMDALLGRSSAVRTVAVTFEPIPPQRSTREVEAAITRDRADRELRGRFGQSETARQRQAQEATSRREAELAAGHCEVRLAGFVTVSGRNEDELRGATAEVLEHAALARLELHRMYGQQADAFTFTLPLCRGLR